MRDSARLNAGTGVEGDISVYIPSANLKLSAPIYDALLRADRSSCGSALLRCMVIIYAQEGLNLKWRSFYLEFAHLTAYAPDLASLADFPAWLMVIACTDPVERIRDKLYYIVRTDRDALPASYALFLIDNNIPFLIL